MPNKGYYKSQHWEKLRKQVLRRDGFRCQLCGALCLGKKRNGVSPHVDHIQPRPDVVHPTPFDVPGNLRTICSGCHNQVTSWDRDDKPTIGFDGLPVGSDWKD